MAIEEPKYTVGAKTEEYEIREYESTLVAETKVDANFEDAGNQAFKILADYIFGNNTTKVKIDMTAPVSQASSSQKIDMTAPVSLAKAGAGFVVQFTMPAKFNLETLPKPNDARVLIKEIPKRKVAVYSYSGSWSEERYNKNLSKFLAALDRDKVKTEGEPIFARFNSPFQLWFLRRNEIWISIVP